MLPVSVVPSSKNAVTPSSDWQPMSVQDVASRERRSSHHAILEYRGSHSVLLEPSKVRTGHCTAGVSADS
eukprot:2496138-Rhodomonas_salina.1